MDASFDGRIFFLCHLTRFFRSRSAVTFPPRSLVDHGAALFRKGCASYDPGSLFLFPSPLPLTNFIDDHETGVPLGGGQRRLAD